MGLEDVLVYVQAPHVITSYRFYLISLMSDLYTMGDWYMPAPKQNSWSL